MSKKKQKLSRVGRQKDRVAIWVPKIYKPVNDFIASFQITVNNKAIIYAHNNNPPCWWEHVMNLEDWEFSYQFYDFGGYLK